MGLASFQRARELARQKEKVSKAKEETPKPKRTRKTKKEG